MSVAAEKKERRKKRLSPIYLVRGLLGESYASIAPDLTVEDLTLQPLPIITHANLLDYFDNNRRGDDFSSWMVQTQIIRYRSNLNEYFYPRYQLLCLEPSVSLLMAIRPNFFSLNLEIYDIQSGHHGGRFTPSSRMYLGTLECVSQEQGIYRLVKYTSEKEYIQLAAFMSFQQEEAIGSVRLWKAIFPENSQSSKGLVTCNDDTVISTTSEYTSRETPLEKILVEVHRKYRLLPKGFTMYRSQKPVYENVSKKHFTQAGSSSKKHGGSSSTTNKNDSFFQRVAKTLPPSLKSCSLKSCDGGEKSVCNLVKHGSDIYHCDFTRPMSTLLSFAFSLCQLETNI